MEELTGRFISFLELTERMWNSVRNRERLEGMLYKVLTSTTNRNWSVSITTFDYPPGSICAIWKDLAARAFNTRHCDFYVLLGDDVILQTTGWPDIIQDEFTTIASKQKTPYGFGAVAFLDVAFPGFPTFPVIHRTHFQIMKGELFPSLAKDVFINQDLDPFLFELYARFGCAKIAPAAKLKNDVGGDGDARYEKIRPDASHGVSNHWTEHLRGSTTAFSDWLAGVGLDPNPHLGIDIVVPTFRAPLRNLERILALQVPPGCLTRFVIIFDNPLDSQSQAVFHQLQDKYQANAQVRLRMNIVNRGAAATRNRGLSECTGEFVIFLDDDVIPSPSIIAEYIEMIRQNPDACGFVGPTLLPNPVTPRQWGVKLAGITHFWELALHTPRNIPWGITANICVKRTREVFFREESRWFPKTGGGEDIDFCLRLNDWNRRSHPEQDMLIPAPKAVAEHDWWNDGECHLEHFAGWAKGDGALIELFPELTYWSWPNLEESVLIFGAVNTMAVILTKSRSGLIYSISSSFGFVVADWLYSVVVDPEGVWKTKSLQAPWMTSVHLFLVHRSNHCGRLIGHLSRGSMLRCFCRRFDWFGKNWSDWPAEERKQSRKRFAWRFGLVLGASILLTWQ